MQLAKKEGKTLYMVFLDLKKAYDSVERGKILELLKNYGVGNNIINIIRNMWTNDMIVPKRKKYYGPAFLSERGVKQGDVISPTIFNIMIDAVLRHCYRKLSIILNHDINTQFYADDGVTSGEDYLHVQIMLDIMTEEFKSFGLSTEAMIYDC